ncbi:Sphinganine C(4)-monooxygenase 2 [Acorus gramineus]|uniref:aldehyde oxygenase (deformylating) n=1 Tax=Acorus gramineus TaxID=55184 RepID=A0AAV9A7E1_ACOGR|nr:Sphinganine C(4)-monooxygenase 2 [Acorus gramineus]KAK1260533.1 Sphinganine C(4)-monooxygenase 2 [Acorus gramineus]
MEQLVSDEALATFVPIIVYWVYSGLYMAFSSSADKYRLHSKKDEDMKNLVPMSKVIKGVLLQQALQASISLLSFWITNNKTITANPPQPPAPSLLVISMQFFVAMFMFDTWQYFMHRAMHHNRFLYKHLHSWHHRLVVPYAFGAQYNHPVDGLLIETLSGAVAFLVSGMSARTSIFFFTFATIKGIDDHCGMMLPWNPFHLLFGNNAAYHDVHHQLSGGKCNYAQPFFVMWDKVFGTYVPYSIEKRKDGGFEARPGKKD